MFATDISELSGFAIQAGKLAFGVVVILTFQVIGYRIKFTLINKRKKYLQKKWRPYINQVMYGDAVERLSINKKDFYYVLEEINYTFSVLRGVEIDRLRTVCKDLGLHGKLLRLLKSGNVRKKLYALITLGNMRDIEAWNEIVSQLMHKQTIVSLTAARSLVQIDPDEGLNIILPISLTRHDWPWASLAYVLRMAGASRVCRPLAELIQTIPVSLQPAYLRLFEVIQCEEISPVTRIVLENTSDDRVASVCLHITQDPAILPLACHYATHARWHVRMHAATALGRFGGEGEIKLLVAMLKDKEWWVRYRSAQALTKMPFVNMARLRSIRDSLNDRYARDILDQVITEKR